MANRFGDYKRSVRIKGDAGEVEIKAHDTETAYVTSGTSIETLLKHAIEGYNKLKANAPERQ